MWFRCLRWWLVVGLMLGSIGAMPGATRAAPPLVAPAAVLPPAAPLADVVDGTVSSTREGQANNDRLGAAVSTAADLDGDDRAELLIGVPGAGRVEIFVGAAPFSLASPTYVITGSTSFGAAVSVAGDIDGDGRSEFLVGEPDAATVHVYRLTAGAPVRVVSLLGNASFGSAVATAGDVNGDGRADVLVGVPASNQALLYSGQDLGDASPLPLATLTRTGGFGTALDTAGDVNGDGFADVIVGAPAASMAYVFAGSATGIVATPLFTATLSGELGQSVSTAGDVNGDGFSEVLIGAPTYTTTVPISTTGGAAFLYYGSSTGISATAVVTLTLPTPTADARLGAAVSVAGDVNGDGLSDLVLGAPDAPDGGVALLYYGSPITLTNTPDQTFAAPAGVTSFGAAVNTAGDVDGDGFAELLIGAPDTAGAGTARGWAAFYAGGATPLQATANLVLDRLSKPKGRGFGRNITSAGDVNGDGFDDVATAALVDEAVFILYGRAGVIDPTTLTPTLTITASGSFGLSMSGGGDINGDGFDDLIVGAPTLSLSGTNRGRVYAYLGSADGIGTAPVWTMDGEADEDQFGFAVAMAGDVNSDGYMDVLVGAPRHDVLTTTLQSGKAYLYYGSPDPPYLSQTPDWTVQEPIAGYVLGALVAAAGDLNGDGIADLAISATRDFDRGGDNGIGDVLVFYSGANGPQRGGLRPVGNRANADVVLTDDQPANKFGYNVNPAGDVNGDGFGDLLVSSFGGTSNTRTPKIAVYYGSGAGIATTPQWTTTSRFFVNSGRFDRQFFLATGVGDVNGDGFADLLITDRGSTSFARVYFGAESGLPLAPSQSVGSTGDFGYAIGAVGDVNGDGFADLGVGYSNFNLFTTGANRADIFYGSGDSGAPLRPQQRRVAQPETLIGVQGTTDRLNQVRLSAAGVMPLGKAQVALEWQVGDLGQSFGDAGIIAGSTATFTTGTIISPTINGIAPGGSYHWRTRLRYPAGSRIGQAYSRWFAQPDGGWREESFATGIAVSLFNSSVQEGSTVTYTLASELGNAIPLSYTWDLGDAEPLVQTAVPTLTHRYLRPGTYTATVTVAFTTTEMPDEVVKRSARSLVRVPGVLLDELPPIIVGRPVTTTAQLINSTPLTYVWELDNSTTPLVTYTTDLTPTSILTTSFTEVGPATITVRADTPTGTFSDTVQVIVREQEITEVQIETSGTNEIGESSVITVTATGARPTTNLSTTLDLGGVNSLYTDTVVLAQRPAPEQLVITPTYAALGVYTITANVSNGFDTLGASGVVTITDARIRDLTLATTDTILGSVTTLTATVQRGTNITYTWDLEGDGQADLIRSGQGLTNVVQFIYPAAATYNPVVMVENSISGPISNTQLVNVRDVPIAGLTLDVPEQTVLGDPINVTASITAGTNVSYTWDFGDDATAVGATAVHTYTTPGSFTVALDARNGSSREQRTRTVQVVRPILSIGKQSSAPTVTTQSLLTYTLTIENSGDAPANSLVITDELDSALTFVQASNGGQLQGGVVRWTVDELPAGEQIIRQLVVRVGSTPGTVRNERYGVQAGHFAASGTRSAIVTAVVAPPDPSSNMRRVYLPLIRRGN